MTPEPPADAPAPPPARRPEPVAVTLTVNGRQHAVTVEPRRSLVDVLRRELGLTGTHVGCEQGVCGACTVLLDGEPARACIFLAAQAEGRDIETVEGLTEPDGGLGGLQRAFAERGALQCGFCTPGFLMVAEGLLRGQPDVDAEGIRDAVSANLCRCTGYQPIVEAIDAARGERQRTREPGAADPATRQPCPRPSQGPEAER